MSNVMNFTGVEESVESKYLAPGIHEVKIVKVEFGESTTKLTPFMKVFFEDAKEGSFNESFYLSSGALPRVQHLVSKFTGRKLEGEISEQSLTAMLINKKGRLKIDGEKTFDKNGDIKVYARLGFAGFAQALNDPNKFIEMEVKIIDKTGVVKPMTVVAVSADPFGDDLPF